MFMTGMEFLDAITSRVNTTELDKLRQMLTDAQIPFEVYQDPAWKLMGGGYQIAYPSRDNRVCSAITHYGSYGADYGLIEIMGLLTEEEQSNDSVVGFLDADEVFKRISDDWAMRKS